MGKRIRFGGANLNVPAHTWFDMPLPESGGRSFRQVRANVGDEFDSDEVRKHVGDDNAGNAILEPYAERMVAAGFATWVERVGKKGAVQVEDD